MTDLFGTPIIPGLSCRDDFIDAAEEADLVALIDAEALSPFRFQGWLGNRLTHSFGWLYDFDNNRFGATDPLPRWLLPLRDRAAGFARLPASDLVQALLIRYDPGAGIGWHRDRSVFEDVIGVSLGEPATMRFRRRRSVGFDRASAPLTPRSIYHLAGEARREWEHSISPMERTRWSITFRSFTEKARLLAA